MARERSGGGCIAWLALVVAAAALWLAWAAYTRTGGDLDFLGRRFTVGDDEQERKAEAVQDEVGLRAALARARAELAARRAEVAAKRNWQGVVDEVEGVRRDLERAYADTSGEVEREWRELDADLERLTEEARQGSEEAAATLERVLERLRRGISGSDDERESSQR